MDSSSESDYVVTEHLSGCGPFEEVEKHLQSHNLSYQRAQTFWQIQVTGKQLHIDNMKRNTPSVLPQGIIFYNRIPITDPLKIEITWTFYDQFPVGYQSNIGFTETAIRKAFFNSSMLDVKSYYMKKTANGPVLATCGSNGVMPVLSIEVGSNQDQEHVKDVVMATIHGYWDMSFCVTEKQFCV